MFNYGDIAYGSEIRDFKANWKTETAASRRGGGQDPYGQGNILGYSRDFTTAANNGSVFYRTQYDETVGEISYIFLNGAGNPVGWATSQSSGNQFYRIYDIYSWLVNGLMYDAVTTSTPHCNTSVVHSCTGLCKGTCRVSCEDSCTAAHGHCSNVNIAGSWPNPK